MKQRREQLPTLRQFIDRCVKQEGFTLLELEVMSPRGAVTSRYLVKSNGGLHKGVLPNIPEDKPMPADQLWSLCNRLGLKCADFGLFVG